jgi:hypothetical protein
MNPPAPRGLSSIPVAVAVAVDASRELLLSRLASGSELGQGMPTSKRRCRGTSGGLRVTSHSVKRGADSSEVHDTNCHNAAYPAARIEAAAGDPPLR